MQNPPNPLQPPQPQQQQQHAPAPVATSSSNNNATMDEESSKRVAMAGQWRTPPVPFFPAAKQQQQHQAQQQQQHAMTTAAALLPSTTTAAAADSSSSSSGGLNTTITTTAGLPVALSSVSQLPNSTDDYAKALQEAYRRGAAAAMAAAANAVSVASQQQQQQHQPSPSQQVVDHHHHGGGGGTGGMVVAVSCPDFHREAVAAPAPPAPPQQQQQQQQPLAPLQPQLQQQQQPQYQTIMAAAPTSAPAPLAAAPATVPNPLLPLPHQPMQVMPPPPMQQQQQQMQQQQMHQQQHQQQQQMQQQQQQQQHQQQMKARAMSLPDMTTYAVHQEEEKRQKRLARNRASARLRRLRKKNLVDAYEQEVGILEKTLQQLKEHEWGGCGTTATLGSSTSSMMDSNNNNASALTEALSMDRGQQVLDSAERRQAAQNMLEQQLQWIEMLEEVMMQDYVLHQVASNSRQNADGSNNSSSDGPFEFQDLQAALQLSDAQLEQLEESRIGWDEEWAALQTVKASFLAMKENGWLWNESVATVAEQFMSILHKNQVNKLLLWTDHNAEAIDELDIVHAVSGIPTGPVFSFGMESHPEGLLDEEK